MSGQVVYAEQLRGAGDTIAQIVVKTGITRSSLYRHLPPRPPEPVTAGPADRHQDEDKTETETEAAAQPGQGREPVRLGRVASG